jgi:hypothetical protein
MRAQAGRIVILKPLLLSYLFPATVHAQTQASSGARRAGIWSETKREREGMGKREVVRP